MLKIICHSPHRGHHYFFPQIEWREYNALRATALDGRKYPSLAAAWTGPMLLDGTLVAHSWSPLCKQYRTEPCAAEIMPPNRRPSA